MAAVGRLLEMVALQMGAMVWGDGYAADWANFVCLVFVECSVDGYSM